MITIKLNKLFILLIAAFLLGGNALAERTILNVSYDPTREFYQDFNKEFINSNCFYCTDNYRNPDVFF